MLGSITFILHTFSQQHIIDPVRKALDYYTEMEKALEREKQNRADNAAKNKEAALSRENSQTEAATEALKLDAQWADVVRNVLSFFLLYFLFKSYLPGLSTSTVLDLRQVVL